MEFKVEKKDLKSAARAGTITTDRGTIKTPIFMPVGTVGSVKGVHFSELIDPVSAQIILGNTYHLYLRPGLEVIEQAGGLHKFINWDLPILTDSGGYQVYSLSGKRKLSEKGARFQSHIDGSYHLFTPENVIDVQRTIGADFMMAFDECTPYPCEKDYAANSMHLTHRWLKRCIQQYQNTENKYGAHQSLLPIVQGSVYSDLRKQSAEFIASCEMEANAIGGLSVGEPHEIMYKITEEVCEVLPKRKPRYLMGVGTPANIIECIGLGIDMFDCVLPSRNARHGMIYTSEGIFNIKNKKWEKDFSPIDKNSNAQTSQNHSKAYLRHLIKNNELLGMQIATIQNLSFYLWLVELAREKIIEGSFASWKNQMIPKLENKL